MGDRLAAEPRLSRALVQPGADQGHRYGPQPVCRRFVQRAESKPGQRGAAFGQLDRRRSGRRRRQSADGRTERATAGDGLAGGQPVAACRAFGRAGLGNVVRGVGRPTARRAGDGELFRACVGCEPGGFAGCPNALFFAHCAGGAAGPLVFTSCSVDATGVVAGVDADTARRAALSVALGRWSSRLAGNWNYGLADRRRHDVVAGRGEMATGRADLVMARGAFASPFVACRRAAGNRQVVVC